MIEELGISEEFEDLDTIARISDADLRLTEEFRPFFDEIKENFNLAAGHIYSDADLKKLDIEKRPAFQPNLFLPILLKILGDFSSDIPGVELIGKTPRDQSKTKIFEEMNNFYLYQANDIAYEMAKAYLYSVIGRIAWLKQEFVATPEYPQGVIDISHYPAFLKFDTSVGSRNFRDCQFIDDSAWFSPEEIIRIYARENKELAKNIRDKATAILGTDRKHKQLLIRWADRIANAVSDYAGENKGYDQSRIFSKDGLTFDTLGNFHDGRGRFKVTDFYERTEVPVMKLYDRQSRQNVDITDIVQAQNPGQYDTWYDQNKLDLIKRQFFADPYIEDTFEEKIFQTSVCPGLQIKLFEGPQQLQNGNFRFTPVLAYDFHPDILETKSVLDGIKDSVKSSIMRDNTNLTYLMKTTHGGGYAEEGLKKSKNFKGLNDNSIGTVKIVPDGALSQGKFKELTIPPVNYALERYQQHKLEEIKFVSGVRDNAMGTAENAGESGKLFAQRVQQSEIMHEWLNKNALSAMITLSKNNIYLIQNFVTDEQTFRVLGDDGDISWLEVNKKDLTGNILNDVSIGKFDIISSTKPNGRISKELERQKYLDLFALVMQATQGMPEANILLFEMLIEIFRNTDVSGSSKLIKIVQGLMQVIQQRMATAGQPSPEQQQAMKAMMQLDMQGKQLENESKSIDNRNKMAEVQNKQILNQKEAFEFRKEMEVMNNGQFYKAIVNDFLRNIG